MNNLGLYQSLTTLAKKVGGPGQLVGLIFGGGVLTGAGLLISGNAIAKWISAKIERKRHSASANILYTVSTESQSNEGLKFKIGDTFKVLETDGDAGLIEKTDDENNPYFVSLKFLSSISDYRRS